MGRGYAGAGARPVTPWKSPAGKLGHKTGSGPGYPIEAEVGVRQVCPTHVAFSFSTMQLGIDSFAATPQAGGMSGKHRPAVTGQEIYPRPLIQAIQLLCMRVAPALRETLAVATRRRFQQ